MLRLPSNVSFALAVLTVGGLIGDPGPSAVANPIAEPGLPRPPVDDFDMDGLRGALSDDALALARGEAIVIEDADDATRAEAELVPASFSSSTAPPSSFETQLSLCPGMNVSNAPAADANRRVQNFASVVNVSGVAIAVNPTHGACLSSAFGQRGTRMHRGVDYYSAIGGQISAAGDGVVIERRYRDDFGNMLLIDHGGGVYTRYAHLSSFADGIVEGAHVAAGQQIGLMGNTAGYQIPIHLHYELLLGEYDNPRASFGLVAHSPFEFPPA